MIFIIHRTGKTVPLVGSDTDMGPGGLATPEAGGRLRAPPPTDRSLLAAQSAEFTIDDEHRERCIRFGLLMLGLPPRFRLPCAIVRKIAVEAAIAA